MNRIISKQRLIILAGVFALLLIVYFAFLYKLQIVEGERYYEENRNNVVTTSVVTAARGNIYDRYGRILVSNTPCYNLLINENELFYTEGLDPNEAILTLVKTIRGHGNDFNDELPITVTPPFEYTDISSIDAARLSAYKKQNGLDENVSAVELLSSMRTRYKIDSNYSAEDARVIAAVRYAVNVRYLIATSEYTFVEDADSDLITTILENNMPGIDIKESYVREYNTEYAAHLLGYIGLMNDSEYEKYVAQGYAGDAKVGKDGVELAFEDYLHGVDGKVQTTSTANGTVISKVYTEEPQPGNNVYLTIDIAIQEATDRALNTGIENIIIKTEQEKQKAIQNGTYKEVDDEITGAAAVVVKVKTGEPLAIASWPTYNLANLLEDYAEISTAPNDPLYNRALMGEYAPGSTFKPCTSIAALTEKNISTGTVIRCDGVYTEFADQGYSPQCWIWGSNHLTHGNLTVSWALCHSCNYFFYTVGRYLGVDAMGEYAKLFGLGEHTGIELYENVGNMSKRDNHFQYAGKEWTIGDTLQAAIGQADSMFTPLQLAEYCAAIANNGERHSASILKEIRSFDFSDKLLSRTDEVISRVETDQSNWDAVHEGMRLVATDVNGSGFSAFRDYEASTVACKTGTAQKGDTVTNDGIFMCYAPFEDPEIAIAVVVQRGGAGANCAPIAREILETYFNIKTATDVTETEGSLLN